MKFKWTIVLVCIAMAAAGVFNEGAAATPKKEKTRKWEIGIGGMINFMPSMDRVYAIDYSPEFFYPSVEIVKSTARQAFHLAHKKRPGWNLMLNRLFSDDNGIQLLWEYTRVPFDVTENQHEAFLQYIDYPYPELTATTFTREYLLDVPDTEGHFQRQSFSVNLLKRFYPAQGIMVDFSAGPSLFRIKGTFGRLGFIGYHFNHYIQVMLPYNNLEGAIEPATRLGLNFGSDVSAVVLSGVQLFLSARYFYCPRTEYSIKVSMGPDTGAPNTWSLEEMTRILNPPPLEVLLSYFRISVGIKLAF